MSLPGFKGATLGTVVRRMYRAFTDDAITDTAAQLGYYLLFAIFPMMVCLTALIAYLPLGHAVDDLVARLSAVMPAEAMQPLRAQLDGLLHRPKPHLLTLGLAVALYSASRGADAFRKALNIAYDVHETRPFWKTSALALGFTILAATLTLVGVAMLAAGGDVGTHLAGHLGFGPQFQQLWSWLRWPGTALVMMLVAALAYHLLPDVEQRFRYITPGSVISTSLWLVGTWGFTWYVGHFGKFDVTYGSLGGAVVLLTWLYISSVVFIFGGELNAVIEQLAGGKARGAHRFDEAPEPPAQRPSAAPPGAAKDAAVAEKAHARADAREGGGPDVIH